MSTQGGLNIVTDGLIFQVDPANKLGANVTNTKNLTNPTEVGTFINSLTVNNDVFDYDGVDDYIDFGNLSSLQIDRTTPFTFDSWVYRVSNSWLFILSKAETGNLQNKGYNFTLRSNSAPSSPDTTQLRLVDKFSPQELDVRSTTTIPLNTWTNVVVTHDGSSAASGVEFYFNGANVGKFVNIDTLNSGSVTNTSPVQIGAFRSAFFSDDSEQGAVKVYDRVLTPTEIQQNYEATKHRFE